MITPSQDIHLSYGSRYGENENGALRADLMACKAYQNGTIAAATITQPTCCILEKRPNDTIKIR